MFGAESVDVIFFSLFLNMNKPVLFYAKKMN